MGLFWTPNTSLGSFLNNMWNDIMSSSLLSSQVALPSPSFNSLLGFSSCVHTHQNFTSSTQSHQQMTHTQFLTDIFFFFFWFLIYWRKYRVSASKRLIFLASSCLCLPCFNCHSSHWQNWMCFSCLLVCFGNLGQIWILQGGDWTSHVRMSKRQNERKMFRKQTFKYM